MATDKDFQRIFMLERRRAERSRRPFLLLLLDMGECIPCEHNWKVLEKILVALAASTRGTDVTGWYKNNSVLGIMFTEINFKDPNNLLSTLTTRVGDTLRKNLSEEQFDQACISFHSFPEEWNQDIPANPDAPVYSPLKPEPNLRSGCDGRS